jgi:hypothetical protein
MMHDKYNQRVHGTAIFIPTFFRRMKNLKKKIMVTLPELLTKGVCVG